VYIPDVSIRILQAYNNNNLIILVADGVLLSRLCILMNNVSELMSTYGFSTSIFVTNNMSQAGKVYGEGDLMIYATNKKFLNHDDVIIMSPMMIGECINILPCILDSFLGRKLKVVNG
jgi:hypothetical protein